MRTADILTRQDITRHEISLGALNGRNMINTDIDPLRFQEVTLKQYIVDYLDIPNMKE